MGGDQTNPLTEDLFARALTADSSGEAFLVGIHGLWDKINLGDLLSIIGNIAEGAGVAVQAIFRGVLALLLWFPANLDAISDAMAAILKIVAVLLALILVFVVARGVYKKTGIVIMPFDVSLGEGEAISGRAISDLLAGELRRISEIHKLKFEEITIKSESLSLPALTPKGESLEHSMPQVATVGDGQASAVGISISQIIIAFKRHCPGTTPVPVLSGSLQKYGRMIALTASLEDRMVRAWDVERKVRGKDQVSEEHIPSMVRDLAYRIVHDLSRDGPQGIEAKTWQGLKHFTDALAFYHCYTLTGDLRELNRSRSSCLKAVHSEKGYEKAIDLLESLGLVYINNKKYNEAERIFLRLKTFNPERSAIGIGRVSGNRGDLGSALASYEEAIWIKPSDAWAWVNKGITLAAFTDISQKEMAIEAYDQAIKIKPNYAQALGLKGLALAQLGKMEEAIKACDEAIRIDQNNADSWVHKGQALSELDQNEMAIEAYDQAIRLDPNDAWSWVHKGEALGKLSQNDKAIEAYDQAIRLDPNEALIWMSKGDALRKLEQDKKAIEAYDHAFGLDPKSVLVWIFIGVAFSEVGQNEKALDAYDQAIRINPKMADAWIKKGFTLVQLGRKEKAVEACDEAIKIYPKTAWPWVQKGRVLSKLGLNEKALEAYDQAICIDPKSVDAWINKGIALADLGQREKAIEAYDQAIRIDPKSDSFRKLRESHFKVLAFFKEWLEASEKALELDPNSSESWLSKGEALEGLGKHEDAIECFNKSIKINPQCSEAWFHKSAALRSLDRTSEADAASAKAIELGYKDVSESAQK